MKLPLKKQASSAILGVILALCGLLFLFIAAHWFYRKRHVPITTVEDAVPMVEAVATAAPRRISMRGNLIKVVEDDVKNHYHLEVEKQLGKGGCGLVVRGRCKAKGNEYAIKIVNKSNSERGRLDREIKLLKDVDHTNIVRLFEVYDTPLNTYFVMELCTGGHLGDLLAKQQYINPAAVEPVPRRCLDETWAKEIMRQLVSAVSHIHSRGICHRDIKLQNILMEHDLNKSAQIKLIDFGFGSRFVGVVPMHTKCGTPYTTAPEVLRECYDERCDVWSVGVVAFIVLSGKRPFEIVDLPGQLAEAGKAAMLANILMGRFQYHPSHWDGVSDIAKEFVETLLHHDYLTRVHAHEALEHAWLAVEPHEEDIPVEIMNHSIKAVELMRKHSAATPLRRTGLIAMAFSANHKQTANIRSLFQSIDVDHSGSISFDEFKGAMAKIAPDLLPGDVINLFRTIDIDGNNLISYTEFLAATLDPQEVDLEALGEAFRLLDSDGSGYIDPKELRKVLHTGIKQCGGVIDEDVNNKIQEILECCDLDGDGVISYEEFLEAMVDGDARLHTAVFKIVSRNNSSRIPGYGRSESVMAMYSPTADKSSRVALINFESLAQDNTNPSSENLSASSPSRSGKRGKNVRGRGANTVKRFSVGSDSSNVVILNQNSTLYRGLSNSSVSISNSAAVDEGNDECAEDEKLDDVSVRLDGFMRDSSRHLYSPPVPMKKKANRLKVSMGRVTGVALPANTFTSVDSIGSDNSNSNSSKSVINSSGGQGTISEGTSSRYKTSYDSVAGHDPHDVRFVSNDPADQCYVEDSGMDAMSIPIADIV